MTHNSPSESFDQHVNRAILSSLRWGVDGRVVNHEGQDVWLRACLSEAGERIGITDCCTHGDFIKWDTGEVCEHHKGLASAVSATEVAS